MEDPRTAARIVIAGSAAPRLEAARRFLRERDAGSEVWVVGSNHDAVDDLVRSVALEASATFGIHRLTLMPLAARLAWTEMARGGWARASLLGSQAVAARATHDARRDAAIPELAPIAAFPGFPSALASTVAELRLAGLAPGRLAQLGPTADLRLLWERVDAERERSLLADHAWLLRAACAALDAGGAETPDVLLLDLPVHHALQGRFAAALAARAPRFLATVPRGDDRTLLFLSGAAPVEELPEPPSSSPALDRLRQRLFLTDEAPSSRASPDDARDDRGVQFLSAPGEARECVEIARRILAEAAAGRPFDRMAVLLRAPGAYADAMETALARASIPAYFSRGTERPDPSGRAFLSLLACAAEGLSARRFAEYLSLAQVPDRDMEGAPPAGPPGWEPPRDEVERRPVQLSLFADAAAAPMEHGPEPSSGAAPDDQSPDLPSLETPRKWEAHLVEAAVVGSRERWARRLAGYEAELRRRVEELRREDPRSPRVESIGREAESVAGLRAFAIPLVGDLAALPEGGSWGDWVTALCSLAPRALRHPERVLALLAELAPLHAVAPVGIHEVLGALGDRLSTLPRERPRRRHGRVLVAPLADARGLQVDVVFLPGLAERVFPQRLREDPLLRDDDRRALGPDGRLLLQEDRLAQERLLLRLAAGAATTRLYLSWPRLDATMGRPRPRVPSFYLLDVLRAVTGRIRNVEEFEREVARATGARLSWPAPASPEDAVDDMEHDLASLAPLLRMPLAEGRGRARYLLGANPHLARHLRTRHMRWRPEWSSFDGLLRPGTGARRALERHRIAARPYSATSLQAFAACPYRFLLHSIHRLAPREVPVAIEALDPLTRGSLTHAILADALGTMRSRGLFPVTVERLEESRRVLDTSVDAVAARFSDELAPAIPRVYGDEVDAIRRDLRFWLGTLPGESAVWIPRWFEYGFGLPADPARDPESHARPVALDGGYLMHGAIDMIEQSADGRELRVTDFKTGAASAPAHFVLAGGAILQPVLYAMAMERITGLRVAEGRLSFCTSRGRFQIRTVGLTDRARGAARDLLAIIDGAVGEGTLLPAPREDECGRCDFRVACGPYEELRSGRKRESQELDPLHRIRRMP